MSDEESEIFDLYAERYQIAHLNYQMMAAMLDKSFMRKRIREYKIQEMYIYGGGPLGVQLYYAISEEVKVKGMVDASGTLFREPNVGWGYEIPGLPVYTVEEFQKIYQNRVDTNGLVHADGSVIVTPINYLQAICERLYEFVPKEQVLLINEFIYGGIHHDIYN